MLFGFMTSLDASMTPVLASTLLAFQSLNNALEMTLRYQTRPAMKMELEYVLVVAVLILYGTMASMRDILLMAHLEYQNCVLVKYPDPARPDRRSFCPRGKSDMVADRGPGFEPWFGLTFRGWI
jgi:hypothetical protein